MSHPTTAFDLLPSIHQRRDDERADRPLRALMAVVETELRRLGEDVDRLYDDWFVETCAEWLVPYIGDLLGVRGLAPVPGVATERAVVANTIGYRRRKGTAAMLEQLARDVTGWPARAVEYFALLGTTQHLDHPRPGNVRTPDLRDAAALLRVGTPFDPTARSADVRHIDVRRGRHNVPNLGLHLWRLGAYPLVDVDAREVDRGRGRWTFDPAGRDVALFQPGRPPADGARLTEADVPAPLHRRPLHDELAGLAGGRAAALLAEPRPALRVGLPAGVVPPGRLACCDLTDWGRPAGGAAGPDVSVDPVLGRLTLPAGVEPDRVTVSFAYGLAGDLGAGPYDQRATVGDALAVGGRPWPDPDQVDFQIGVSQTLAPVAGEIVDTLAAAVDAWNLRPGAGDDDVGVIVVTDSATYAEGLTGAGRIVVPAGGRLLVVAGGVRPHLVGDVEVEGASGAAAGELVLAGLSIEGDVTVRSGGLAGLVLAATTLVDGRGAGGGRVRAGGNAHLVVRLLRSVAAGVELAGGSGLALTDSLVGAGADPDVDVVLDAPGAHVELEAATVLGRTVARALAASNTILLGTCDVASRQEGCARFSYVPPGSRAPRRHRCLPAEGAGGAGGTAGGGAGARAGAVAPRFTSLDPAHPGFGQLAADCPGEVTGGADDEGEMGAFHFLQQNRRMANLASQLDAYLRFGLEAGVFFAT